MPFKCDDPRVHGKWATETLDELLYLVTKSKETFTDYSVEIVPTLYLTKSLHYTTEDEEGSIPLSENHENGSYGESLNSDSVNPLPKWTQDPRLSFQQLTMEMLSSQNEVLKLRIPSKVELVDAGYMYGWLFYPPIVDAPRMLMVRICSPVYEHSSLSFISFRSISINASLMSGIWCVSHSK